MQIQIFHTLRRTPRVTLHGALRSRLENPKKCTLGRTRRASQQLSGQLDTEKKRKQLPLTQPLQQEQRTRCAVRVPARELKKKTMVERKNVIL